MLAISSAESSTEPSGSSVTTAKDQDNDDRRLIGRRDRQHAAIVGLAIGPDPSPETAGVTWLGG
jgi:hypothetical protein